MLTIIVDDPVAERLQADATARGEDVNQYALAALRAGLEALGSTQELSRENGKTWEELADEMADLVDSRVPPLSDYAVSREGIYEDHP